MKGLEGNGALGAEIGHLAPGVHPGVGAARADDGHLRLRQPGHRGFQHPLDGGGVSLALPAVIAGTVVFQEGRICGEDSWPQGYCANSQVQGEGKRLKSKKLS